MGSVYRRGDSRMWWIAYLDASGKRRLVSSGTTDKPEAKAILRALEKRIAAEKAAGVTADRPLTVARYAEMWLQARRDRGIDSTQYDEDRLKHLTPALSQKLLKDVTRRDVRDFMRGLMAKKTLAPRTMLHVYAALRLMFADAEVEGLVRGTPCTLKQRLGELPKKRDKVAGWRHTAVFTRAEVETLISDTRIPEHRRVLYALLFLGGMRIGEAVARRWRDYDRTLEPLGQLKVATSYDLKGKREKTTKTDFERLVPVHAELAKVLAAWRLTGWATYTGRQPTEDDLMVPSPLGAERYLSATSSLKRLQEDLAKVQLRARRMHDTRRTWVSLLTADGGRKEILHWISHGPSGEGEAFDDYVSLPWETLCAEVSKLNVRVREGEVIALPTRKACYGTATEKPKS